MPIVTDRGIVGGILFYIKTASPNLMIPRFQLVMWHPSFGCFLKLAVSEEVCSSDTFSGVKFDSKRFTAKPA